MKKYAQRILDWYDISARDLPWRVPPGDRAVGVMPDPYAVWMSEIMLQQTTVAAVKAYFNRFMIRWPTVEALAAADDAAVMAEWAGLGYYARARNLLKCARVVAERGGFPDTEEGLRDLPGVGPYTAAAVASIAFDRSAPVMDGNVERVMARMFHIETPLPAAKSELYALAADLTPDMRPGDYAQAVMDLGATVCTPKSPSCMICPWMADCKARHAGVTAELPRKTPKPEKPVRTGIAFVARRTDGAILLETRPDKGLLGGMLGFPGSDWAETPAQYAPPMQANWVEAEKSVTHVFTHFKLLLTVFTATVGHGDTPDRGTFYPAVKFDDGDLPTVMRKVFRAAHGAMAEKADV